MAMNNIYRVIAVGPMFSNHKETPYNTRLYWPLENNLIRRKVSLMNILKRHQNIEVSLKAGVGKIGTLRVVHKNAVFTPFYHLRTLYCLWIFLLFKSGHLHAEKRLGQKIGSCRRPGKSNMYL